MKIKRILFVVIPLLLFLALVLFPWKQMNGNAVTEGSEDTSELVIENLETEVLTGAGNESTWNRSA